MHYLHEKTPTGTLIRRCLNGQPAAWELLSRRYQPSALHYAAGFFPQGKGARWTTRWAMLRALETLPRLRSDSLFSSYLLGILRKRLKRDGVKPAGSGKPAFWNAFVGLPRVQREVVFLFFQGFSLLDVAHIREEKPERTESRFGEAVLFLARRKRLDTPRNKSCPHCISQRAMFLALAKRGKAASESSYEGHFETCSLCRDRWEKSTKLFYDLQGEVSEFNQGGALVSGVPVPSRLAVWIAAALVAGAFLLSFFLLRGVFADKVRLTTAPSREEVRLVDGEELVPPLKSSLPVPGAAHKPE